jgi:tRNA G10  N-methylase Trm11
MIQSICILGRQPALGLAELESLYGAGYVSLLSEHVAALDISPDDVAFARLGGSTRLARVLATVPSNLWKDVEKQLAKSLVELAGTLPEGKLQLGISVYNIPVTPQKLTATGLTLKKIVRSKAGRSLRLSPNNELELNTAQVLHNHLTGSLGVEFLICATPDGKTVIARTIAVQDIDSYTLRDRGRPRRDARVGMLPPKLAQIIINLAVGTTPPSVDTVVLDPFCGTGVLLQEAIFMGYGTTGTDLEPRMITYSRANLEWFTSTFEITNSIIDLTAGDATEFSWQNHTSCVATETYLGRPFTEAPSHDVLEQTASDVNSILKKFLRNIHGQIAADTRLCLAVPAWQVQPNVFRHLPLLDSLEEIGYNRVSFEHVRDNDLLYYREDQIVARELLVLRRK